jgi:alkanesulfonate monooxygenase SsuD/methylene tetrahydromethanopterin reductase-like flavin-dependent oxidoreductase (luciferase family)
VKFGVDVPISGPFADVRLLCRAATEAETAGWDGFFIQEVFSGPEPVVDPRIALGAVAMATQTIQLGAFLTPLPRRLPWEVARQAATIDHLSNGRLIFGAGLGNNDGEFAAIGRDTDRRLRADQLDEGLQILDRLWRGEPVKFSGQHHRVDGLQLLPTPLQNPRIPVWVAAGWPARRPLRRAALWDGVYLMTNNQDTNQPVSPADVSDATTYLRAHRTPGHRPVEVAVNGLARSKQDPIVAQMASAGATWWVEYGDEPDKYRTRIRGGPPRPQ